MIKKIILLFILWQVIIFFFSYLATFFIPQDLGYTVLKYYRSQQFPYFLWIWGNFDGFHYLRIAQEGYGLHQQAFFPLFPFFIKLLTNLSTIHYLYSGKIISTFSFLISLIIIGKLILKDEKNDILTTIFFVIIFFPTSFFYTAIYNDSLFLLFSTLCMYFARKKLFLFSSFMGAFATLTRLNGLALIFFIFFEYLFNDEGMKNQWNFKKIRYKLYKSISPKELIRSKLYPPSQKIMIVRVWMNAYLLLRRISLHKRGKDTPSVSLGKLYFLILIPISLIVYLLFINIRYGDWNLVFSSMETWNRSKITFPPQVLWRYLKIIFLDPSISLTYAVAWLELAFVIFYSFISIYSYKKIRFSYWIFMVISFLIPSLTGTFQGMPRYGLHLYPLFLSIAILLTRPRVLFKIIYFIISFILFAILLGLYTRGYFVA